MQVLRTDTKEKKDVKGVLLGTRNFLRIQAICEDAFNNKKMIVINGQPGYGKTTALEHYSRVKQNVFMITVRPSMKAKHFWASLCESIPGDNGKHDLSLHSSIYYILCRIVEKLKKLENSLLIFDEAGKSTSRQLELIHELRDQTKDFAGIVLAGPNYFKSNLLKWVRLEKIGMGELLRRINYFEELMPPQRNEIRSFCNHYGVTDPDVVKALIIETTNFGTLHNNLVEYQNGNFRL